MELCSHEQKHDDFGFAMSLDLNSQFSGNSPLQHELIVTVIGLSPPAIISISLAMMGFFHGEAAYNSVTLKLGNHFTGRTLAANFQIDAQHYKECASYGEFGSLL